MSSRTRTPLFLVCLLLIAAEPPIATLEDNPFAGDREKKLPVRPFVRLGARRLQQEYGLAVAFSPDGKTVAIHDTLWDVHTGKKLRDLQMPELSGAIWKLAFAPDSKCLAGQCKYCVRLWETATGKELRVLSSPKVDNFHALTFSPDGKQLATSIWNEKNKASPILLWETATGRELRRFTGHQKLADQLAFSTDGRHLTSLVVQPTFPCSGRRDPACCSLVVWDVANGKELYSRDHISSGALSPDGKLYTRQGEDGRIEIHDLDKRRRLRTLETRDVWHAFSADGKLLACADDKNTIRIWDIATGRLLKRMSGRREERPGCTTVYYPFGFSPEGKLLITGSHDSGNHTGRIRLWDVDKGEEVLPVEDHFLAVTCVAFSADGKTLVSGSRDRTLHLWDTTNGRHLRRFIGHKDTIDAVVLSPSGRFLSSSSRDKTLRLWDARSGRELHCLDIPAEGALSVIFLEDDKTLQWWDLHGNIHYYDVGSGKRIRHFRSRRSVFHTAPLGGDGLMDPDSFHCGKRVPWSEDLLPAVLREKRDKDKNRPEPQFYPLCHIRVSSDGRMAATSEYIYSAGGEQCRIRVWEVATSGLIADLGRLSGESYVPIFSRNNWGLFVGCDRGVPYADFPHQGWDLIARKPVECLQAPISNLHCLTMSPDGTKIAAGGNDASVVVWNIAGLFRPPAAPRLTDEELRRQADCLSEADAAAAYRAMYRLARSPKQSVPFLHERLRNLAPPIPRLRRLLADLDDDAFAVREKATEQLQHIGPCIEGTLRSARENAPSPEVRRRLDLLLEKMSATSRQRIVLEVLRGISVLERIGTSKARAALHDLAKTSSESDVGMEAKAALQRLTTRSPIKP